VHHLAGGVHAGVGASRRHRMDGPVRVEGGDGVLKGLLHAGQPALALPAVEGSAVVLEAQGDAL
jgi:hypothetical protein